MVLPSQRVTNVGRSFKTGQGLSGWVHDFQLHIVETFQNHDGSRVASRWRVTGRNCGLIGTQSNGASIEMTGTAVWELGPDVPLRHNWVERKAFEVHGAFSREGARANIF